MRPILTAFLISLFSFQLHADPWTKLSTPLLANLHSIISIDSKNAFAVGDGGAILQTTNGGIAWLSSHYGPQWNGVSGDTLHQVMTGGDNTVRYATGGKWQTLPTIDSFDLLETSAPLYFDSTATGSTHVGPTMYTVNDQYYYFVGDQGYIKWINFKHERSGFLDNEGYWEYKDTNTFNVGITIITWPRRTLRAVACYNPYVYVVGDSGLFLRSSNRGDTYVQSTISTGVKFNCIAALNLSRLIAVGDSGNIWTSHDNGLTWKNVSPPGLVEQLNAVTVLDSIGTGIIAGNNGLILKTTDAGATWVQQSCNSLANLNAVSCFNGDNGYGASWMIAGDSGTVLQCFFGGSIVENNYSIDTTVRTFGAVAINVNATKTFTIQNNSSDVYLAARAVSNSPSFIVMNNAVLDPLQAGNITIKFQTADTTLVRGTILLYTDEKWIPDTLAVSGSGVGAIAEIETDSLSIDAKQGETKYIEVLNLGNGELTSILKFVSDTNLAVVSDASAPAHDSLHVTIQMKHTLDTTREGFFVLKLNDYRNPNATDTIHISMIGQPSAVRQSIIISPVNISIYPNPVRQGSVMTITNPTHSRIIIYDDFGNLISASNQDVVPTNALTSGVYWVNGNKFVVQ